MIRFTIYLLAAALLAFCYGCVGTYHALGIATTADIEAQTALDETDHEATTAALDGRLSPEAYRSTMIEAREHKRVTIQEKEQSGGGSIDWNALAAGALALIGTIYGVRAHTQAKATKESLAETDKWVGDVEKKAEAKPS